MAHSSLWAIPSLLAFTLLLGVIAYIWRNGTRGPIWPMPAWVLCGSLLFTAGDLLFFFAPEPISTWTGLLGLYTGLITVAGSIFVLTARYAELHGGPPVGRGWSLAAPVWAVVCFFVVLSNPLHEAFLRLEQGGFERGPLWYPYAVTGYAWVLGSIALATLTGLRARTPAVRREAFLIATATAVTLSGNFVEVTPFVDPPFDPTSLGMVAGCALAIGAVRLGLPNLGVVSTTDLLRSATDGILLLDLDGGVIARNAAVETWLPGEPSAGKPLFPVLARAFVQRERADLPLREKAVARDLLAEDQPEEGHLFRLVGQDRWVRVNSFRIPDRGGAMLQLLRLRDETRLQRLAAAAEDQASMLEAVNSATDEGVLVHVGDEIRFVNPQFHEIWRTPDELRGARTPGVLLRAYLPQIADQDRFMAAVERVREDPRVRIRDEYRLADGRTLERISLPLVRGGEPIGRVWRVRDVTEQREAENALLHAQKLESLGLLSGGIAHDFNNLLVSMLGSADLARSDLPEDSPAQEYLADVERAAERASELTRQLLAYAGKGRVENEPVHLSEIATEVMEILRVSIPKGVRIESRLAVALPTVTGDASQLRQLVMNLVMNAADSIGGQPGTITLTTELRSLDERDTAAFVEGADAPQGKHVVVTVEDTGAGMSPEVRQRIFDPFFTTKFAGRGLGLAATLGIVRSHRGRIGVESKPGAGSRFVVALAAEGEPVPMAEARRTTDRSEPLSATVLVVDDEPHVARVASRMVEAAGGQAILASGGEAALERLRAEGPEIDLVLLDLTMPGMSGRDTLVAIREIEPHLPVVLTSGYPAEEVEGPLGSDPALAFIQKPYRSTLLVATLRRALGRWPG